MTFFLNFPISRKNYLQCECSKTHLNFTIDNMKITNMPIFFNFLISRKKRLFMKVIKKYCNQVWKTKKLRRRDWW